MIQHRGIVVVDPYLIGRRVRELRLARTLSQQDLADRIGAQQTTVSAIERGENYPSIQIIQVLAEVLGTNVDYLLGNTDNSHPISELLKTVSFVDPDDERRTQLRDLIDKFRALPPEARNYAQELMERLFP